LFSDAQIPLIGATMKDLTPDYKPDKTKCPDAVSSKTAQESATPLSQSVGVSSQTIPPQVQQPSTGDGNDEGKKETASTFDKITFFVGIIGLLVLIWQTFLLKESNESTKSALKMTRDQMVLDNRAWVFARDVVFTVNKSGDDIQSVNFSVECANNGQTPAINVVPVINHYFSRDRIPERDAYPNPVITASMLATDQRIIIPAFNEIPYERFKAGGVYVAGTIFYNDIFGKPHWSQFCFLMVQDLSVIPMPFHHTCDDADGQSKN
jgi:hypothetical protein